MFICSLYSKYFKVIFLEPKIELLIFKILICKCKLPLILNLILMLKNTLYQKYIYIFMLK